MVVPCNTELKVGDVITALFPKVNMSNMPDTDEEQSGKYLIKGLLSLYAKLKRNIFKFDSRFLRTLLETIMDNIEQHIEQDKKILDDPTTSPHNAAILKELHDLEDWVGHIIKKKSRPRRSSRSITP